MPNQTVKAAKQAQECTIPIGRRSILESANISLQDIRSTNEYKHAQTRIRTQRYTQTQRDTETDPSSPSRSFALSAPLVTALPRSAIILCSTNNNSWNCSVQPSKSKPGQAERSKYKSAVLQQIKQHVILWQEKNNNNKLTDYGTTQKKHKRLQNSHLGVRNNKTTTSTKLQRKHEDLQHKRQRRVRKILSRQTKQNRNSRPNAMREQRQQRRRHRRTNNAKRKQQKEVQAQQITHNTTQKHTPRGTRA